MTNDAEIISFSDFAQFESSNHFSTHFLLMRLKVISSKLWKRRLEMKTHYHFFKVHPLAPFLSVFVEDCPCFVCRFELYVLNGFREELRKFATTLPCLLQHYKAKSGGKLRGLEPVCCLSIMWGLHCQRWFCFVHGWISIFKTSIKTNNYHEIAHFSRRKRSLHHLTFVPKLLNLTAAVLVVKSLTWKTPLIVGPSSLTTHGHIAYNYLRDHCHSQTLWFLLQVRISRSRTGLVSPPGKNPFRE